MATLPELLAPAGDLIKLQTALAFGADAVYVGAAGFSQRPDTASFSPEDLATALAVTHAQGRRLYVAANHLLFEDGLQRFSSWLEATRDLAFDALIVGDAGALHLARERRPELALHISTQLSPANHRAVRLWADAGARRVILARECSVADIAAVVKHGGVEVEAFVHGSMCLAVSGRCLLSSWLTPHAAADGQCKHVCRWEWEIADALHPEVSLPVVTGPEGTAIFGSADLCLLQRLPELVATGVHSLKIEGRMKSAYYVAGVTRVYRAALDACRGGGDADVVPPVWWRELDAVGHRPYSEGFTFRDPSVPPAQLLTRERSVATTVFVGQVVTVSGSRHRVMVKTPFSVGDRVDWIGPGMAGGELRVAGIVDGDGSVVAKCHCGTRVDVEFEDGRSLPCWAVLRRGLET